jgi:hypothetical protein
MIIPWMLYSIAVGLLLGVAALAGERVCRLARVPGRWVWMSALTGTMVLSGIGLARMVTDSVRPELPRGAVDAVAGVHAAPERPLGFAAALTRMADEVRRAGARGAALLYDSAPRGAHVTAAAAGAWVLGSLSLFVIVAATLGRLRLARRRWREHVIGGTPVLVSSGAGPAVVGLLRPRIVVPEWLLAEPAERQRIVVMHEDQHRRARDPLLLACACASVCVLPWNPAAWWMLLRIRLAVELDCDARVLRCGVVPRTYGSLLLHIAARTPTSPFGSAALTTSTTQLERRLVAMTDSRRNVRRVATVFSALGAVLLVAAACTTDLPTAAAIDAMDATEAQNRAEQVGLLLSQAGGGPPLYVVDGAVVSEEEARRVVAERIRAIEVIKGPAARETFGEQAAAGVVKITTLAAGDVADPAAAPLTEAERRLRVDQAAETTKLRIRGISDIPPEGSPLILVDGVVTESAVMQKLDPDLIDRVEIVKGEAARRTYADPRASNGVILITTRR